MHYTVSIPFGQPIPRSGQTITIERPDGTRERATIIYVKDEPFTLSDGSTLLHFDGQRTRAPRSAKKGEERSPEAATVLESVSPRR